MLSIIERLPNDYWHHWNRDTGLVLIVAFGIIVIVAVILHLLTMGRKAVQMEIGRDYVRFRKSIPRGGIMLSDKYVTLIFSELHEIGFRQVPIIGYVLHLKTATETYNINLLLSPSEKVASYRILDHATNNWRIKI